MWLAPNMVTLLGFLFIVANVFLVEIFIPDLQGPVSPLIPFVADGRLSFCTGPFMVVL